MATNEQDILLHKILCPQGPDVRTAQFTSLTFLNFYFLIEVLKLLH